MTAPPRTGRHDGKTAVVGTRWAKCECEHGHWKVLLSEAVYKLTTVGRPSSGGDVAGWQALSRRGRTDASSSGPGRFTKVKEYKIIRPEAVSIAPNGRTRCFTGGQ